MNMFQETDFNKFLLDYNQKKSNKYSNAYATNVFDKVTKNNGCILKYGKSKSDKQFIYDGRKIGGMKGTMSSTTDTNAQQICNNPKFLEEYLKMMGRDIGTHHQSNFNIRITIVEGTYVAAILKIPIHIIGDGVKSIEELIYEKNLERKEMPFFRNREIQLDETVHKKLSLSGVTLADILPKNQVLILKNDLNILNGAESLDVTDQISQNVKNNVLHTVATIPGLSTACIDLTLAYIKSEHALIDNVSISINSLIHYLPFKGESRQVLDYFVKSLLASYKDKEKLELSEQESFFLNSLAEFKEIEDDYYNRLIKFNESEIELSFTHHKWGEIVKNIKEKLTIEKSINNIEINKSAFSAENHHGKLDIQKKDVLKLINKNSHTKKIAKKALKNVIIPFPNFDPVLLDENYYYTDKTQKYGSSYQLYIQSLRVCSEVLLEFERTNNINYLLKAKEIIYLWIDFVNENPAEKMIWYDHPTAYRAQTIIHFLYLAKKNKLDIDDNLFKAILVKHGEVLMDDSLYKNNNHGLMMDKALLVLSNVLSNKLFFNKGYYRAIETFWYSFSAQGVHLENSPDYHNMVVRMYNEIELYLNVSGQSFKGTILNYLKLAEKYLDNLKAPNNKLPAIGDSNNTIRRAKKYYNNFCDIEAGIGILQYSNIKSFYANFVCGYSSKVHKHKDDLSINLNYNGEDFIVDSGKFNYNKNSPIRKYMISKEAHSLFTLKNYDYTITPSNRFNRNVKISGYNFNQNISFIKGKHKAFDGVEAELSRAVIQINRMPILIIVDDCVSESYLSFVQTFNLHEDIKVSKKNGLHYLDGKHEQLVIRQFREIDDSKITIGDISTPVAVNTSGFGEVQETNQIKFEKDTSDKTVYLTAIYDEQVINKLDIAFTDGEVSITINDKIYNLNI